MPPTSNVFSANVAATTGSLDGQYLWSNPNNWSFDAAPTNGQSVIVDGSGVDDIATLSLTSFTETGGGNLFYAAGTSLTIGTINAVSNFQFYAGILGVSTPVSVNVGTIVGGGGIFGAVGGAFNDLATTDPGEHYFAGYGGSVTLSAAPGAGSILEFGVDNDSTIALKNQPVGSYGGTLEGLAPGDVIELPGTSVVAASFGTGTLSITTSAGAYLFTDVQYDAPVTGETAAHSAATGLEAITLTGPDVFSANVAATSGSLDGQYLWSNPNNWSFDAAPTNGQSVIVDGSGVDDIATLSLTSFTETGGGNLFYAAGTSLTIGTINAVSNFQFYAGILGVSTPVSVSVGTIVGGGGIFGAVGGAFNDLATTDPGEHYFAGYGGSVTLSAAPVASSILEFGVDNDSTIALKNQPVGSYGGTLEGLAPGDVIELPGTSVVAASFGTGTLSITTSAGAYLFTDVQYDAPVTGETAAHSAATGLEAITLTGPDVFSANVAATSGSLDGQYLWSNPNNWSFDAAPTNGQSVIVDGSGVDDIATLSLTSFTETGGGNLFYAAGTSLTIGTINAVSNFQFYAGILGVSTPVSVSVGTIVGGGGIFGAVGGAFNDLATTDPGEHYFAGYGGSVTLSAAPVASSILEFGVDNDSTIALKNQPVGSYGGTLEGLAPGDVIELPGTSVVAASFGTGTLSVATSAGAYLFTDVQYDAPVTGETAAHSAATGLEAITLTGPDVFSANVAATSGSLDGQYLWSNPNNWSFDAAPTNGQSVIVDGSGVDDIATLSLTSFTETGGGNLFYAAGTSLTIGTINAVSGFEFYAGILGVSTPVSVNVGTIVGGGGIFGAVGGAFNDLATTDPGEHYFAGYGGSVTLSAAPVASSILEFGVDNDSTIALKNQPVGSYGGTLEGLAPGDVIELPGTSVVAASFGTGTLSVATSAGAYLFTDVQYDAPVTGETAAHSAATGLEAITLTGPDVFSANVAATSGSLDGQYLWSNPNNWSFDAAPTNGQSVIVDGSGVDDIATLSLTSFTETGGGNLFYAAGTSLTIGTINAVSGFEFYAGILGVSTPVSVNVGTIVGGGGIFGAVGGAFNDLATTDPGEHYFAGYGGSVTLSAAPVASSILEFGVDNDSTIALKNQPVGSYGGTLEGLAPGDVIELPGTSVVAASFGTGTLSVATSAGAYLFTDVQYDAPVTGETATHSAATGLEVITLVACYREGTMIGTPSGAVAIEHLSVGDAVLTLGGNHRSIKWLGFRTIDCTRHAHPSSVWPIRVNENAFAEGVPSRALYLSPDHAVFAGGALIPIKHLVNGASIQQEPWDVVTYWHVELDRHDVVLAESLPCETYLDTGNRSAFANEGAAMTLHPSFERDAQHAWACEAYAPLAETGHFVNELRQIPSARARTSGLAPAVSLPVEISSSGRAAVVIQGTCNRSILFPRPDVAAPITDSWARSSKRCAWMAPPSIWPTLAWGAGSTRSKCMGSRPCDGPMDLRRSTSAARHPIDSSRSRSRR